MKVIVARYNEDLHWILPIIDIVVVYNKGADDLDYIPGDKIIKCANLGREGETYVKHIIANYDDLDDYTIFIQGNIDDHIYLPTIKDKRQYFFNMIRERKTYGFRYISTWQIPVMAGEFCAYDSGLPALPFSEIPSIGINTIIKCILGFANKKYDSLLAELGDKNSHDTIAKHKLVELLNKHHIGDEPIRTQLFGLYSHVTLFDKMNRNYNANNPYTYGSGALFICSAQNIRRTPKNAWTEIAASLQSTDPPAGYGLEKMWRFLLD